MKPEWLCNRFTGFVRGICCIPGLAIVQVHYKREHNTCCNVLPTLWLESLLWTNSRADVPSVPGVGLGEKRRGSQIPANREAGRAL